MNPRSFLSGHDRWSVRPDDGFVTVWTVLAASGVFLLLLGLVYDGGTTMNDRLAAHRAAEQAARAAADQVTGIRSGDEQIDVAAAHRAARTVLQDAGWTGLVDVSGLDVTVTVVGVTRTVFLGAVGLETFPVDEQATATVVRSATG